MHEQRTKFLRESIPAKELELKSLRDKLESEKRARNPEEKAQFQNLTTEIADMRSELAELEKEVKEAQERAGKPAGQTPEQRNAAAAAGGASDQGDINERQKIVREFSFTKMIRGAVNRAEGKGGALDGLEREMHDEANKEAREAVSGELQGVGIPSWFMKPVNREQKREMEQRALTVGTAASAGRTVATDLMGFVPALRPELTVLNLGAQSMSGLVGNINIPRETNLASLTWEGETDENAEDTGTVDLISLTPNRGGVTTPISKQLIIQSSIDVERWIRNRFEFSVAKGIDRAAIYGSGVSNQPKGILNFSGLGSVAIGANGGALTYAKMLALKKAVAVDDALVGNLAFLTNPDVIAELEAISKQTSGVEGNFIKNPDSPLVMGYKHALSTQVPNNLTKGSGSDLSAIIFGNWNSLIIANWGGIDLVVDPYTLKKTAQIEITINSWWDVDAEHENSFAAIQDATTTTVSVS